MPDVRLEYDWLYGTAGVALFVVGVLAATVYACAQEMRQKRPVSCVRKRRVQDRAFCWSVSSRCGIA